MLERSGRPVFLDLTKIRLPAVGLMSICHRISGVILFFSIPFVIGLLGLSLGSEAGFARTVEITDSILFKLALVGWSWALAHHFLAGIRILLIDIDVGIAKLTARASAKAVLGGGIAIAVMVAIGGLL